MENSLPSRIGRYEIINRLAAGGMGVVYLARDPALKRTVAIKVLPASDDELRERFAREARSAAALRHNNVVTVYDVGDDNGRPFIAMEFLDGESMAEMIRRRAALPVERQLNLIIELCAGLGFAHGKGIIHRDVKPANLMITTDGSLKILDFGLAHVASETGHAGLTRVGLVMGTPHYMSPEQAEGNAVDLRSDIFSVGTVLYELLTGRKAYPGEKALAVVHKIIHAAPTPIRELLPSIDSELEQIVGRLIEKDPERRYQSLNALAADLRKVRARLAKSDDETLIEQRSSPSMWAPQHKGRAGDGVKRLPNFDAIAQRRSAQVDVHLKAAAELFAAGRYDETIEECENAVVLDQEDHRALELIDRAHTALDDRRVSRLLAETRAHISAGDLTEADLLIEQVLTLRAESAEALDLRRDLKERRRQRERAAAGRSALDRAKKNLEDGALESANRCLDEAVAYEIDLNETKELRERIAAAIEERWRQGRDKLAQEASRLVAKREDAQSAAVRDAGLNDTAGAAEQLSATLILGTGSPAKESAFAPERADKNRIAQTRTSRRFWLIAGAPVAIALVVLLIRLGNEVQSGTRQSSELPEPGVRPLPESALTTPAAATTTPAGPAVVVPIVPPTTRKDAEPAKLSPAPASTEITQRPAKPEVAVQLGSAKTAYDQGDYAVALSIYEGVLRVDPGNVAATNGVTAARRAQLAELRVLKEPVSMTRSLESVRRLNAELAEAQKLYSNGDYDGAIAKYEAALRIDPKNPQAMTGIESAQRAKAAEEAVLLKGLKKPPV